jgi:cytoskeletal protein CcmA (bactofilin family)
MIGQGISISGDVSATSNLKVEGRIEGRAVESSENVEIAESGKVTASVTARTVRIAGEVTGDVAGSDKVIVSSSGRVEGNIVAPRVQLEDGALFRGSIDMSPSEPAAAEKPAAAKAVGPEKAESKAAPAAKSAAAGGGRQEPGLTLKSG